jgi:glycosyltransferase involved in cell wall biosynthesis
LRETSVVPNLNPKRPLKVAWITYFPIEWLPDLPDELKNLPRLHPATWQRVLWEEFRADDTLDLHVVVLRNHFPKSICFRIGRTTFHCVKTFPGSRAPSLYWTDTFLTSRVLKRIRPDLLHAWGTEFGSAAVASRLSYPALVTMQGILTWLDTAFPLNRHMKISRMVEPMSLKKAHIATCESSFGLRYLQDRYPRLKLLQIEHAPNPIFSQVVRQPQLNPIRILCIGLFSFSKGADVVLNALAPLGKEIDFELLWIGARNPPLEEEVRSKTGDAIWKRMTFRHDLLPVEIAQELARATFLLHAARADNSPNAVKEAVVAGVPVIATNTGGIPDYVFPGLNGFLFESGNVDDCRAKIREALTHPLFKEGRVDSGSLDKVRDYLSAKTMAAKFRAAYAETLRSDPRARATNSR